ncbi:MAG: Gfo/Idh/MocA family oxidoreductase, partial [Clostridia bacterium]|nr:Gfo/Idh/MocA family oxidoreductase [Clostridia bacterium]
MANKKRVCLIGLGTITQRYISGLTSSDALELVAVSDINESAVARKCYENYPFYRDYKLMISDQKPDYVIISTPPEGHFDIAQYCLNNDIGIIIEKP